MYIYQKENNTKFPCIINLNIIYLPKNPLIGRGNLSKGEGPYFQNLMVCIKSFYCIPLGDSNTYWWTHTHSNHDNR